MKEQLDMSEEKESPWWAILFGICFSAFLGFIFGTGLADSNARIACDKRVLERENHCEGRVKFNIEYYKNECYCGQTQTCPFGPGIVGEQKCSNVGRWSRCEPKVELEK